MYSFSCFFKVLSRCFLLRNPSLLFIPLFLIITVFVACTNTEDFANPLDSENLRTAGAPKNLTLYPGDREVRLTWTETGTEGIKAYKIYRRLTDNPDAPFELVATVDAPASEFVDTLNIENDLRDSEGNVLAYEYRISYIDMNDVETPDPANPPNITDQPLRIWQTATTTPSIPPPVPVVTIGEPTDLVVYLFWEDYVIPPDFSMFRVDAARDPGDGQPLTFKTVAEQKSDQLYYLDANFIEDNVKRVYRVTAIDEFGVEATTTISATTPNLPPTPPKNFQALNVRLSPFNYKHNVIFTWTANTEQDIDGYQIYTKDAEDNLLPRLKVKRDKDNAIIYGQDPVVIDGVPSYRSYFITAFDNTPRPDGELDESEMVEAQ